MILVYVDDITIGAKHNVIDGEAGHPAKLDTHFHLIYFCLFAIYNGRVYTRFSRVS